MYVPQETKWKDKIQNYNKKATTSATQVLTTSIIWQISFFIHCSSMRDGTSLKLNVHQHIGKNSQKLHNGVKQARPLDFTQQRNLGTQHTTKVTFMQGFQEGNDKLLGDMKYFGGMMPPKCYTFFPSSPTLICPIPPSLFVQYPLRVDVHHNKQIFHQKLALRSFGLNCGI